MRRAQGGLNSLFLLALNEVYVLAEQQGIDALLLTLQLKQESPHRREEGDKHGHTLLICTVRLGVLRVRDRLRKDRGREEKRAEHQGRCEREERRPGGIGRFESWRFGGEDGEERHDDLDRTSARSWVCTGRDLPRKTARKGSWGALSKPTALWSQIHASSRRGSSSGWRRASHSSQ